ncbi:uncharacterized protein L201_002810 [Kwoniella dendrophila CBS 6074]|uniref:Metallo-beta-lactamase domain-containing protein n=1 Tax=Kwoniella dendrophila CBS 6074 TaxID=1295534 RepID=A0AAX4JR75_9TREE
MSPPSNLTPVDKLEFLILVDNFIEWFSVLPPGFTHELPQHVMDKNVPKDELSGLPIVDLDNYCCGAHGLSILIKTTIGDETHTVLFDSGPEPYSIERNIKSMKVDLKELDAIALSHWHRDHSGGILKALEIRRDQLSSSLQHDSTVQVDLHPDRPIRRGISRPPEFIPICSLPPDPTFEKGNKTGVGISGEIKRVTPFEKGLIGALTWMKDEDGKEGWFNDHLIKDERYAVVDVKGHGLVVFSSCSHAGICNVVHSLQPLGRPLHAIVGGLHLSPIQNQPAKETIEFLTEKIDPLPKYILPLHCTGLESRSMLREKLGSDVVVPCGTGIEVIWSGDDEDDARLGEGFKIID